MQPHVGLAALLLISFGAALHSNKPSNAPRGHLWTRQVKQACKWVLAFLEMQGTGVLRTFPRSA